MRVVFVWLATALVSVLEFNGQSAARREATGLPARYCRYARGWAWLGDPAFFAMLAVFCLMVAKPALWA